MQILELRATPNVEPIGMGAHSLKSSPAALEHAHDLDEPLAEILRVMNAHGGDTGMKALGKLLAYMEDLERKHASGQNRHHYVLMDPLTLSI